MHRLLGNVRRRRAGLGLVVVVVSGLVAPVATPRVVAESASPSPQPVAHDTPLTNTEAVVTAPPPGAPALVPTTEIASMRTAHAKTFATEQPGKYTSRVYAHPIHFKDAAGIWQDIDMTLVPQAEGRLRSRAHSSAVSVAPTADDGQLARVDFDAHHSVAYGLAGASPVPV
ncbi:MAG TPA: hypothetical protein VHF47_07180, partial [Acidimicrobiales bacterium]|nr:hypothetical protein [Acidimicrobiales bacterium]